MDPPVPPSPTITRRRRRRELDARRSKGRIRLGGHLEQWCQLKEQLGFSLHSQLAKFLLDRYSSQGCVVSADPNLLHPAALQRLVALSHGHSRECGFVPDVKPPTPGSPAPLVWECVAGHRFTWGAPDAPLGCDGAQGGSGPTSVPIRRRSLRRMGMVEEHNAVKDDADWSDGGGDGAPHGQMEAEPTEPNHERAGVEEKEERDAEPQEEEEEEEDEEEDEDFAEEDDLTYNDDLRDENYHPAQDSDSEPQRRQIQPHSSRKKPVKEEQTPNEQNPIDSNSDEKGGRVSAPNCGVDESRKEEPPEPSLVPGGESFFIMHGGTRFCAAPDPIY